MYFTETDDGLILNVKVKAQPRSSKAGINGLLGDAVKVRIRCAPVDGKANKELIEPKIVSCPHSYMTTSENTGTPGIPMPFSMMLSQVAPDNARFCL